MLPDFSSLPQRGALTPHNPLVKILLPLWLALFAGTAHARVVGEDHETLAKRFLESYSLESAFPEGLPLAELLEGRFVSARIGLFDLRMPVHSLEKKRMAGEYIDLSAALLMLQVAWLEWMGETVQGSEEILADCKLILKEFKRFKVDLLMQVGKSDERDFFTTVSANEATLAALERVAEAMTTGAPLSLGRENEPARIVLFPDRKQFVEFVAYIGWSDATKKPHYWVDGTDVWTECFIDDTRAACLEFPALERGDYTQGTPMNEKNPKEMQQQLTQIAGVSLLETYYGSRLPSALIGGLANNLVIEVYGEVDTRLDGAAKGNETFAHSVFIPGGNSDGGFFPKKSAENRWRADAGRDHFMKALKNAQKQGKSSNKSSKHKYKSFLLLSQNQGERHVVTAPFFGTPSVGRSDPPVGVRDDYLEFLRAYKSGFLHWLRTQEAGKKKSAPRFAEFVGGLAQGEPREFEKALLDFYGMPLSSTEVGKEDLEGRFLKSVSK